MTREHGTIIFCVAILAAFCLWKVSPAFVVAEVVTPIDGDGDLSPVVVTGPGTERSMHALAAPYRVLPPALFYVKRRVDTANGC